MVVEIGCSQVFSVIYASGSAVFIRTYCRIRVVHSLRKYFFPLVGKVDWQNLTRYGFYLVWCRWGRKTVDLVSDLKLPHGYISKFITMQHFAHLYINTHSTNFLKFDISFVGNRQSDVHFSFCLLVDYKLYCSIHIR